eukprot:TRINITY_DN3229_c0_g1_i1.p1 TRINITY_DN3229_c0_g1~~TRINITY_DN3229_c0_g1_i1.p1  ORF type:complete len:437 (+),score=53.79 TRINITY_DN3229_c0_g1_i1:38-1348(+)
MQLSLWPLILTLLFCAEAKLNNRQTTTSSVGCNCISFRLDSISDYNLTLVQSVLIGVFQQEQVPLTVGIIGNRFGKDAFLSSMVLQGGAGGTLELANAGWDGENYGSLSLANQINLIGLTDEKIFNLSGTHSKSFIPPNGAFSANTAAALESNGYEVLSSFQQSDSPPYGPSTAGSFNYWRFPSGARTRNMANSAYYEALPYTATYQQIVDQMENYGFASISMTHFEFASRYDGQYVNSINNTALNDLRVLLKAVKCTGLRLVLLGDMQDFWEVPFTSTYDYTQIDPNCVSLTTDRRITSGRLTTNRLTTSPIVTTSPLPVTTNMRPTTEAFTSIDQNDGTESEEDGNNRDEGLTGGAIAGIVIGVLIGVGIISGIVGLMISLKKKERAQRDIEAARRIAKDKQTPKRGKSGRRMKKDRNFNFQLKEDVQINVERG